MAIAFVGGAVADIAVIGTSMTVTYAATTGNILCAFATFATAPSALTVKDSNANLLTAGPTATNTSLLTSFFYTASAGVTSLVAAWTASRQGSLGVVEYSGVTGGVNAALAGNVAIGTSTLASITVTTEDANDWVVAGLGTGANTSTILVGNAREKSALSTAKVNIGDNTAATPSLVTVSGTTLVSGNWEAIALELRLSAGVIAANNFNQLMMVGCGT